MSLQSPRRIFARSARRTPPRRVWGIVAVLVALATAAAGGLLALVLLAAPGPAAPAAAGTLSAAPSAVAVVDGQTLRLGNEIVQLDGVHAPARGQGCARSADCGGAAAEALAMLVHDRRVECRVEGADRVGRLRGQCRADGEDINRAVIEAGWSR